MANLKADLDDYLRNGNKKQHSGIGSLVGMAKSFTLPTLKLGGSSQQTYDEESASLDSISIDGPESRCSKCLPSLTKRQRLIGFLLSLTMGMICFGLSMMYLPVIVLKARKFSLLFSLGSAFAMTSFSFLYGPYTYLQHLMSRDRLPFTSAYFGSLFATLYFAMALQSTILTTLAATIQIVALLWFLIGYIPGGTTGMKYLAKMCTSLCRRTVTGGSDSGIRASLPI